MHALARFLLLLAAVAAGAVVAGPAPAAGPPPNDDFANAVDLGAGLTASATAGNRWATAEAGEPAHHGRFAKASVWYRWTAPRSGVVAVDTCGSALDTILAVYRGSAVASLGRVASNDDACDEGSRVRFFGIAGTTYPIAIDSYGSEQGSFELNLRVEVPPPNDDFAAALDLGPVPNASASGTNRGATAEPQEPAHHGREAKASVWYRWTAPARREVQVDTCGSGFDTVLAVYAGNALDDLRSVGSDDDSCRTRSVVRFDAAAGTTYAIAVDGYGERAQGSVALRLQPSNAFRVVGVRRNGGRELVVSVPNPGRLRLARTRDVRRAAADADGEGRVRLPLRVTARARDALRARGSARLRIRLTYTPEAGRPRTATTAVRVARRL